MHTLYALTFLILCISTLANWIHTSFTLRVGTECLLENLFLLFSDFCSLISSETLVRYYNGSYSRWWIDSLLTFAGNPEKYYPKAVLFIFQMLCIENAFAERLHIAPYRSGFCVIIEAVSEWIQVERIRFILKRCIFWFQAFNCFRVGFLFMILHDTPVTILNFFFLTSCRCPGPHVRNLHFDEK